MWPARAANPLPFHLRTIYYLDSTISNDIVIGNHSNPLLRCLFIVAIRCPVILFLLFKFYFVDKIEFCFDILEINVTYDVYTNENIQSFFLINDIFEKVRHDCLFTSRHTDLHEQPSR